MKSLLKRWSDNLRLVSDVIAIGFALDDNRITAPQASGAIARAGERLDLERIDTLARQNESRPERREGQLANS